MGVPVLAILGVTAALLVWLQIRHVRRVAVERRAVLDSVRSVLEDSGLTQRGIDYPVLTGLLVFYVGFLVALNLLVDIAYGWLDPRVRGS